MREVEKVHLPYVKPMLKVKKNHHVIMQSMLNLNDFHFF